MTTRAKAVRKGGHFSVDKATETGIKLWPPKPQPAPVAKYRFKDGDRVMIESFQNVTVRGTVRWIGPLIPPKESQIGASVVFAGIETVSAVYSMTV